MDDLRYPIGLQTFSKIIEEGYTYVDKTAYVYPLLHRGQYIFLSRPRRFGKSLLLSMLEAYFEGRRDLFKGLAADTMDLDWTPSPVLHFDFNAENFAAEGGLSSLLNRLMEEYEERYGMTDITDTLAGRFSRLIRHVAERTGRKVVILIDEYDKPLLAVEDNKVLYESNQQMFKGFFGNLKSMDRYIRFAFITGVARFSKISIFSDLNNLDDISMVNDFADICGWSEKELLDNFCQGIARLAEEREESTDTTLRALRDYYDGYLFTKKGNRLYNPFSVLKALKNREIEPYWFETGTPTFLARRVKARRMFPPDINGQKCTRTELLSIGLDDRNPIPLMFQTGYLTIVGYNKDTRLYELSFPNREVEIGFYEQLLPIYVPECTDYDSPFRFALFKNDLFEGRPLDFMERLKTMLKGLPYEDHNESVYRAITYLLVVLCGSPVIPEHHGYKGRSDIEVFTGRYIYIFEFKYNRSVKEAMDQIHDRDYAGRYALGKRKIYLIGANFVENKESRLLEYEVED